MQRPLAHLSLNDSHHVLPSHFGASTLPPAPRIWPRSLLPRDAQSQGPAASARRPLDGRNAGPWQAHAFAACDAIHSRTRAVDPVSTDLRPAATGWHTKRIALIRARHLVSALMLTSESLKMHLRVRERLGGPLALS